MPNLAEWPPLKQIPATEGFINHSCLSNIFRTWFWRFYDNLFPLIILNFVWFVGAGVTTLLYLRFEFFQQEVGFKLLGGVVWYLTLCFLSVGWASVIFRIFNNEPWTWNDLWSGTLKFGRKAIALSVISGLVFLIGFLSLGYYSAIRGQNPFLWILLVGTVSWTCVFWGMTMLFQWPILFFQNPSLGKILYRSALLAFSRGAQSLAFLFIFGLSFVFFSITMVPWFFFGGVYFFSIQCVVLEKIFIQHRIVLNDKPIEKMVELFGRENARGWSDFVKPWENR